MKTIHAFLLGLREFRFQVTTSFDHPLIEAYDKGRDLAHLLTLRVFEQ